MPDKQREKFFVELFVDWYNSRTQKTYRFLTKPEEDEKIAGTYDFLYYDEQCKDEYLAIEEKSLNKSTENARDRKEIGEIVTEVNKILEKKGLFHHKKYFFHLEFKNAPRSTERDKYAHKIADVVEDTIGQDKDADYRNQVILDVEGCDSIKKFCLLQTDKSRKVVFGFAPESSTSRDVQRDTFHAVAKILKNSDPKLKIPKKEEKKTILLITNDWNNFILADQQNVTDAVHSIEQRSHEHIDELFFINKKNLEEGYNMHKVY